MAARQLLSQTNLRATQSLRLPTRHELLVKSSQSNVAHLPADYVSKVRAKETLCTWLLAKEAYGVSLNNACDNLRLIAELDDTAVASEVLLCEAMKLLACGKKSLPSRSTLLEWLKAYRTGGTTALMSGHWSRERKTQGWEAKAVEIFNVGGKPSMAAVARDLKRKHGFECSVDQVRDYLSALPVHLGARSAGRLGIHLFRQIEAPYMRRSTKEMCAGDVYMADGYRADVYLAHPMTGDIWRPEIMHVIDIKTQFLVGYRIMANEGTYDVMIGWAEIFSRWNHVCPIVYIDNGSGYANKIATDDLHGYYKRAGVQEVTRSLPKNAKGKGNIERYHRVVRDDFLKTWQPQFYCGPDMAKDVLDKTTQHIKNKTLIPPTLAQFVEAYDDWLANDYHLRPARDDKKLSRAEAFAQLAAIPPYASAEEIARPSYERTVQRASVRLFSREYNHPDLIGWNHRKVRVELDVFAHGMVTIRDMDGRLLCDAPLIKTIGVVSDSLLEDKKQKAVEAAVVRLERQLTETKARAGRLIDADAVAEGAQAVLEGESWEILGADDEPFLLDLTLDD
jgi:putative transposase